MAHAYVCTDVERLVLDCCHRNDNSCLGRQLKPCPTQPAPNFSLAVLSHPATRYSLVSLSIGGLNDENPSLPSLLSQTDASTHSQSLLLLSARQMKPHSSDYDSKTYCSVAFLWELELNICLPVVSWQTSTIVTFQNSVGRWRENLK